MTMLIEIVDDDRLRVTVRGHTWENGIKAPDISGWRPCFVEHHGHEKTVWTYRKEDA